MGPAAVSKRSGGRDGRAAHAALPLFVCHPRHGPSARGKGNLVFAGE